MFGITNICGKKRRTFDFLRFQVSGGENLLPISG